MKDYNFFDEFQKRNKIHINFTSPAFLGVLVIALIIVFSAGLMLYNTILGARLTSLTEDLTAIHESQEYQKADELQKKIGALTEYDQYAGTAYEKIKSGDVLGTDFLYAFSRILPSSVSLQNASINRATATFTFTVPDRQAAAELVKHIDESDLFVQTTLISVVSQQGAAGYTAVINSILKAGE